MALAEKTILITGGLGGIGLGLARELLGRRARVILSGRAARDSGLAAEAAALGPGVGYVVLDVTDEQAWPAAIETIEAEQGRLDGLVNNAGLVGPAASFEATTLDSWRRQREVNLDGAFLGCRFAIEAMARTGGGAIVNISSAVADFTVPEAAAYITAKSALLTLTRLAAKAGARHGVRVNAVLPGAIDTPMLRSHVRPGQDPQAFIDRLAEGHPIGRIGAPLDIARAVTFLLDPEAGFVTGSLLAVDGGQGLR